jgi:putative ATP-dependent endonuclease of the OLD family
MKINELKIHGIKSYVDETIALSDYTAIVGENNSGKSNALHALLWFFGKEKLSQKDLNSGITDDPFVEVEFELGADEEFSHPQEYLVDGKFRVRGTISRSKLAEKPAACEYYGYTGDDAVLKETKLIGWKNVAKPSLGDVIYMPSMRPLSDELKFTANSAMNQLVTKNIVARIKLEDEKSQHYTRVVEAIGELSSFISTGETSALNMLQKDIAGHMLDYGKVKIGFELVPPDADELIKACFKPHTSIDGLSDKLPLASQGDGFQRSMMFSLIANLAELNKAEEKAGKKGAKNECTFYIIEEPELFLHPNHQAYFRNKLEEIASASDAQVILTSHSPYFLNHVENYSQVKRVYMDGVSSKIAQVTDEEVDQICIENGNLMADARNACQATPLDAAALAADAASIAESDHIRYLLWIDPTRANAFLSEKVILVEGPTEKALFSFLFSNPKGAFYDESGTSKITVIDTVGKYHFFKFSKLLKKFGIKVWAVYDTDNNECKHGISHKLLNDNIAQLKNDGILEDAFALNPGLEEFLGLTKTTHMPDIGMYVNLEKNTNNCVESPNFSSLVEFIKKVISA